jgi:hypothetical protein
MSTNLKQAILEMRAAAVARRCRINHIEVTAGYALDAVRTLDDTRAYQMCRMQGVAVRREGVSEGEAGFFTRLLSRVWGQPVQAVVNRG